MLEVLKPVVQQLEETYEAVQISLRSAGPERLGWKPNPHLPTFAEVAEHIASANLTYAAVIGPADVRRKWDLDPAPSMDWLLTKLNESLSVSKEVLEGVTAENLTESRENDWCPNCDEQLIQGPLDALWFAMQMVRHTAYHLGQLNLYLRLIEAGGRE
jgi:uncharacterized damage-inducible protein DinB